MKVKRVVSVLSSLILVATIWSASAGVYDFKTILFVENITRETDIGATGDGTYFGVDLIGTDGAIVSGTVITTEVGVKARVSSVYWGITGMATPGVLARWESVRVRLAKYCQ